MIIDGWANLQDGILFVRRFGLFCGWDFCYDGEARYSGLQLLMGCFSSSLGGRESCLFWA